jgi:phosphatidate phosphatase APP1
MRLKDRTLLDIARPGRETKPPQIAAILARFPERRFTLIGDSGEDDPEIYVDAYHRAPAQIARILIRNVTAARRDDARFSKTFTSIDPARWALFDDPAPIGP